MSTGWPIPVAPACGTRTVGRPEVRGSGSFAIWGMATGLGDPATLGTMYRLATPSVHTPKTIIRLIVTGLTHRSLVARTDSSFALRTTSLRHC